MDTGTGFFLGGPTFLVELIVDIASNGLDFEEEATFTMRNLVKNNKNDGL